MTIEQTVFDMMTTSTGRHMLDSGGANGRHWQRNQKRSIEDFLSEPEAVLSTEYDYPEVTVSLFHKLTSGVIYLDEFSKEFNSLPCGNWDGDYYGTSVEQCEWLVNRGFDQANKNGSFKDAWNTYNWENNFSQVLQGHDLVNDEDEDYVLIQIHQGADVRGGYTDAKLFRLNDYVEPWRVVDDRAYFSIDGINGATMFIDCTGSELESEGTRLDEEDIRLIKEKTGGNLIGEIDKDF